jgi:hypothetical protein
MVPCRLTTHSDKILDATKKLTIQRQYCHAIFVAKMPGEPESIIDLDVSGDASHEGLTSAIDDDAPMDGATFMSFGNDENRLAYIEDVFAGSSEKVTPWKSQSSIVSNIELNGAESRLLGSMKEIIEPILSASFRLVEIPVDAMKPSDFASIYANRDWYLMLLDYVVHAWYG